MYPVYRGESLRLLTPDLWWDLPDWPQMVMFDKYRFHFNDFDQQGDLATTVQNNGLITVQDTGVTINPAQDTDIGELDWAGMDATQDEGNLSVVSPLVTFAIGRKLWFECRVKKVDITDDTAMFVGLAWDAGGGSPVPAGFLVDTSGALIGSTNGMSLIGFHVDIAAAATVDFVFGAEGVAPVVSEAGVKTMVADTYTKLGFKYDPGKYDATGRFSLWIDETLVATREVTQALIAGSTFPTDELLTPTMCLKIVGTADTGGAIDWWAVCQELAA